MKKTYFILLSALFLFYFNAQAQNNDKAKKDTVEEVEEPIEFESVEIGDDAEVIESTAYGERGEVFLNGKKFQTIRLNQDYELFFKDKYSYNPKYGVLKNNKIIFPTIFSFETYHSFHDAFHDDKVILGIGHRYGIFDLVKEKWVVDIEYKIISRLSGNYYSLKKESTYVIMDLDNTKIIEDRNWTEINSTYNLDNYYFVRSKSNSFYGLYNLVSKRIIIPEKFQSISYLSELNVFSVKKDNLYNLVDIDNRFIFKNWYNELSIVENYFIVNKNGRYGVIDIKEKEIVPIEYLKIRGKKFKDGSYLAQNKEGKFGCITIKGEVTLPFIYNNIENKYYNNYLQLKLEDEKCGVLRINDGKPHVIATCEYDNVDISSSYFIVKMGDKYGLLDSNGEIVLKTKYSDIKLLDRYPNIFVVKEKNKTLLFHKGRLSSKRYKSVAPLYKVGYNSYSNEKYIIVQCDNGKFGLIDKLEVEVVPCKFQEIKMELKDNLILVKENDKVGIYNILKQKYIIPAIFKQIVIEKKGVYYGFKGLEVKELHF